MRLPVRSVSIVSCFIVLPRLRARVISRADGTGRYICQTGRTSTKLSARSGIFLAHSIASCLVAHSIR
jgi:hypothetical protein